MKLGLALLGFWILGMATAFMAMTAVHGLVTGSSFSGYPPFSALLAAATGIPCYYLWRFVIR